MKAKEHVVNDNYTDMWHRLVVTNVCVLQNANFLLVVGRWGNAVFIRLCIEFPLNLIRPFLLAAALEVSEHASLIMGDWVFT
jgi:hypothetical protein